MFPHIWTKHTYLSAHQSMLAEWCLPEKLLSSPGSMNIKDCLFSASIDAVSVSQLERYQLKKKVAGQHMFSKSTSACDLQSRHKNRYPLCQSMQSHFHAHFARIEESPAVSVHPALEFSLQATEYVHTALFMTAG